jgi:phospholipid/cholesterol/gamma-HCH transport system substrate-binding protein
MEAGIAQAPAPPSARFQPEALVLPVLEKIMFSQVDKFKIGLFVVASVVLASGILIWLGAAPYFEDSKMVVAYFSESVQGLEADSTVKFRGVPVGRVRGIRMAPDGRLIEIAMSLNRNFQITEDLGVKMNLLGLTGLKYLEMDTFRPEQRKELASLDFQPRYPVIATYSSDIREIGTALEKIFQKANAVDVEAISGHMLRVSAKLDKILSDPKVDKVATDAADALREVKDAAKKVNDELTRAQPARSFARTLEKASEFFQESTETARSADRLIRRQDNNLNRLSQKLDRSAEDLMAFARMIRLKPSSLILGSDEKTAPKR